MLSLFAALIVTPVALWTKLWGAVYVRAGMLLQEKSSGAMLYVLRATKYIGL